MIEGAETLSERICAVECINQNLLNSYDRLMDRLSLHKRNIYAIKIMSKDEIYLYWTDFIPWNPQ